LPVTCDIQTGTPPAAKSRCSIPVRARQQMNYRRRAVCWQTVLFTSTVGLFAMTVKSMHFSSNSYSTQPEIMTFMIQQTYNGTKQLQEAQLTQRPRDASCHWIFC